MRRRISLLLEENVLEKKSIFLAVQKLILIEFLFKLSKAFIEHHLFYNLNRVQMTHLCFRLKNMSNSLSSCFKRCNFFELDPSVDWSKFKLKKLRMSKLLTRRRTDREMPYVSPLQLLVLVNKAVPCRQHPSLPFRRNR